MPFLHHHGACLECDSYAQHYGLAIALNEDGVMKLDEAWKANDNLQVEIKDLHKKLGEAPHSSVASIPPPPPVLSDEQFARDLEHARITSLGSKPHNNQSGIGTSLSMWGVPPPNTYTSFSSRGRAQVEQPADHKGKQRQPSPPQVEPACPPMEDEITPSDLYTDVPMTINELIIQGTMFPNFDGTEYPYRVLHLGQGNDSIRSILFMRINDNLYAYGDKMIGKVISNMNKGVPPPVLTHKRSDLVMYINLWKRCRLETNEVMDLMLKEWRPPIWASQKLHQKREVLRDKERASRVQTKEGGPSRSRTVSGRLTLQGQIMDVPPIPSAAAAEEPRPIMPLAHHVVAQPSGGPTPNPYQRPPESSQLMYEDSSSTNNWCQSPEDTMTRMSGSGQYRALLEWAEVAPANGTPVPWEGEFTHSATLANVATYLAANGIMYHDANDALKWAQRAGNECVAQIISNGGDKDPNTKAIVDQMRAALNEPLPMGEHHSLEWSDLQACVLGILPENIVPYEACPIEERDLFALEEFAKSAALYDLSH
ncbi:hypothetical protein EDC04DRAFT_2598517 [Pisolithus marmoratus]|nr:hypothetical protein EDC04DRAFT_2598517 [Pisolithus marmoratus]